MPIKVEKTVSLGSIGAILSPVLTLIIIFVTMWTDVQDNISDIQDLKGFNENIGHILTSHTTQLAVKDVQFAGISKSQEEIKEQLNRVEEKLDNY